MQSEHDRREPPLVLSFRVNESPAKKLWRFKRAWKVFFGGLDRPSTRTIAIVEISRGRN